MTSPWYEPDDDDLEPEDEGLVALLLIAVGLIFVVVTAVWLTS